MSAGFSRSLLSRSLVALVAASALTGLGGCYSEGGLGWSEDQHVFISRPQQPWNVTLRDTRTGQELWTAEVPVGKQLVVHFLKDEGTKDPYTPDVMEWGIMNDGDEVGRLGNRMPVPPANARRIEPTLRATPELPPRMVNATTPSGGEPKSNGTDR